MDERNKQVVESVEALYSGYLTDKDAGKLKQSMEALKTSVEEEHGDAAHRIWFQSAGAGIHQAMAATQPPSEIMELLHPGSSLTRPSNPPTEQDKKEPVKQLERPPTSKELLDLVFEHKETLAAMVPAVNARIRHAQRSSTAGGCSGCARNRAIRDIATLLARAVTLKTVDLEEALEKTDKRLRVLFQNGTPHGMRQHAPGQIEREACRECVNKHLSQAMILCDEVLQGYPAHVDIALEHLKGAVEKAPEEDRARLMGAMMELEGSMAIVHEPEKCKHYLLAASKIMENSLGGRRDRWRLIGHLAEAADECVKEAPMLAQLIRTERLKAMDDPSYKPDVELLLNVAASMKDKKGSR